MLVDFLLALRADVKGVMRRVRGLLEKYDRHGTALLDCVSLAELVSAQARNRDEAVNSSEAAVSLQDLLFPEPRTPGLQ